MFVQVNVINGDKIQRDLALFPKKAERIYGQAVNRAAETLRDDTKRLRPVSAATTGYSAKGIPVDKGVLRQSIHKKNLSRLAAGVFPKVHYGRFVHDGTKLMPARPYFEWALELGAMKKIDDIFQRYSLMLP